MKKTNKSFKGKKTKSVIKTSIKAAGKKNKKNKKNSIKSYILIGFLSFLLTVTVAVCMMFILAKPQMDTDDPWGNNGTQNQPQFEDQNTVPIISGNNSGGRNGNKYNLLLVGKDYLSGSTDVIMLASVDTQKKEISIMQIPRDSYVECGANNNLSKRINAVYSFAWLELSRINKYNAQTSYSDPIMEKIVPNYIENLKDATTSENIKFNQELINKTALEYLKETIKQTFCIAIDGYAMLDVEGFREIVDVLGGVHVDVPQDMHYEDPDQNLYIHINKGYQLLDGEKAEGFVRFRKGYADQDIGRGNAQKIFLTALAKKVMSISTITKIQPLIETSLEYITTNLTLSDIIGYAKIILETDLKNIKFYTAAGEPYQTTSGAWYYSLYMNQNLELINQVFNDYNTKVGPEDVTLKEVVNYYDISYNNQGITAQQIDDSVVSITQAGTTYGKIGTSTPAISNNIAPSDVEDQPEDTDLSDDQITEDADIEKEETELENDDIDDSIQDDENSDVNDLDIDDEQKI